MTDDERRLLLWTAREVYVRVQCQSSGQYDQETLRPLNADWLQNFDALTQQVRTADPAKPSAALAQDVLSLVLAALPELIDRAVEMRLNPTRGIRFSDDDVERLDEP